MALKFGVQQIVSFEAMDDIAPFVLSEMTHRLLKGARPDWETLQLKIERGDGPLNPPNIWLVRLECLGGTRDCEARRH